MLLALLGCVSTPSAADSATALPSCEALDSSDPGPTTMVDLTTVLSFVRDAFFPELDGVSITLGTLESDADMFASNLDFSTIGAAPLERDYVIHANLKLLDDPPPSAATGAILAHELKHTADFTSMDAVELAEFGAWYDTTDDFSAYERQTDEHVLALGCGRHLSSYRTWLYDHVSDDVVEEKRHDYYTPEEIDAWITEHTE